jgi:tetratricopeptide (TPR) repeat protein
MMKLLPFPARFLAKFLLIVVLVGCVAAQQDSTVVPISHAEETAGTPLPDISLTPDLLYKILVAEIAGQRGEFERAGNSYLQLARDTRDPRLGERAAQIAVFVRDKQQALEALKLWVELDPGNIEARQALVAFLVRNGQADAALEHLEIILASAVKVSTEIPSDSAVLEPDLGMEDALGGESEQGFMQIAALLARESNKKEALRLMGKFAASHKDSVDAQFAYASLALSNSDLKLARAAVEDALKIKPGWLKAVVVRARIMQLQDEAPQALAYLKQFADRYPDNLLLRLNYARLLVEAKQLDEARAQFNVLAQRAPENAGMLFSLGLLSIQINQLDEANNYLTQVSKLGKFPTESSYYLGQIAETRKQYSDAITWYKVVDQGEAYLDAQLRVVAILARQGDIAAARTHLHGIQLQDPQQEKLLIMAEADLLREEKKYKEAMALYDRALTELPQDNTLLYGRAMLAEKMDRLDILEQDLRNILTREPDNARALNALGYTLADRTRRYEEALGYIKRALALNPQDAATLDSIGWVQYRLGNAQEAVQNLQSAYKLDANAEIAAHLGEVLWVSGDREGARKVWEEALKSEPKDEALLNTMKRLQAL